MKDYLEFETPDGVCYLREDRVTWLAEVDVAVFDCDGVLLDIRESYWRAAAETAAIILEALTGSKINAGVFSREVNFAFKKTGGFNNDWSLTYAYVMAGLCTLPDEALRLLDYDAARIPELRPAERLRSFSSIRAPVEIDEGALGDALIRLASSAGPGGVDAVDQQLLPRVGASIGRLLRHREEVGVSVVSTLFEELFAGASLFEETFGFPTQFTQRVGGYIDAERVVPKPATFLRLERLLGGRRFGIASGSLMNSARHALGDSLQFFPREAQVWHDDVDRAIAETGVKGLHKPCGYPLRRASSAYEPYKRVVYVGDTMADLLTSRKAAEDTPRYTFMGVYSSVDSPEETLQTFIREGADAVAPSVNQLPDVLKWARSEQL